MTKAFIADRMKNAVSRKNNARQFLHSNYQVPLFPKLWVRSPTQASGELDKVVGFPVVEKDLRRRLKDLPFDVRDLDPELREELADLIYKATLQPVSTFMNSLRERLSAAARAGSGAARVVGSYVQGAIFNPRTLIALLNIFRVSYNYFELRTYSSPFAQGPGDCNDAPKVVPRALRIPGTDERIETAPTARRTPDRKTPAMRHGIDAFRSAEDRQGRCSRPPPSDLPTVAVCWNESWRQARQQLAGRRFKKGRAANPTRASGRLMRPERFAKVDGNSRP